MSNLFKSHINALIKVRNQLHGKQTMNYKQLILGKTNTELIEKAESLVNEAINVLMKSE